MSEWIEVRTERREQLVDITRAVSERVAATGVDSGVLYLWSMHTTCGLTVNESADPDVAGDMERAMARLAPRDHTDYRHFEGNTDSHIKTSLFGPGLTLLIEEGRPLLGRWQGIFLAEWDGPRTRRIAVKIVPD